MRKHINIVGVGRRMAGVGKTSNNPYDFTPVSFTYEDSRTNGVKAATCNINQTDMGSYTPCVGDVVEVVMREDFRSGKVYVDAVI